MLFSYDKNRISSETDLLELAVIGHMFHRPRIGIRRIGVKAYDLNRMPPENAGNAADSASRIFCDQIEELRQPLHQRIAAAQSLSATSAVIIRSKPCARELRGC